MFSRRTDWKLTPNRFTQVQHELRSADRELLDLTISNPTRAGLPYHADSILVSLSHPEAMNYDPQPKGLIGARQGVASYYREQGGIEVNPESLVLTTSTSEGYSYIFRLLCNPADEILVPKPSYPLFEFLADLDDVTVVPYPLIYDHGWQVDFPSLRQALSPRTRAVVLVHPNNPTGSYVSTGERTLLNTFSNQHGLALIVDEVFLDYPHDGVPRPSFVTNGDVLTFTLSGLSKISGLPQMKLAWVAVSGPEKLVAAAMERLEVVADTYLSINTPVQLAASALLGERRNIQPLLLERVSGNLGELDRRLAKQKSCQRLLVEGGWYAVLRVPVTQSDEELAIDILRNASVLVHPGHFYDFPSDGYLIVSLLTPPEEFRQGIERTLQLLNR
ncbi:MAG TPA: pyridoxal phosphate-dependent aminotransferase [Terriglobales bacterium]|jgi:aspartate/methionine/tyrosine aminotransferase|nr:pyridoxal phosphate-dependent aminotransferase [Terriglobales bacterium]